MTRTLVPLWLTLGFAAGLVFGWMAFREGTPHPPPAKATTVPTAPDRSEIPVNAGTLRAIELTFERWGGYAVWENDVTEIAAWDARRQRHADFYEVRRYDGKFSFRSLRALTRPIIDHGVNATLPFAFTEPLSMREQFYREHPDYAPATAPRIDLPPRPPERSPISPSLENERPSPLRGGSHPGTSDGTGRMPLTSGTGG